jgi:hypothetical protein
MGMTGNEKTVFPGASQHISMYTKNGFWNKSDSWSDWISYEGNAVVVGDEE